MIDRILHRRSAKQGGIAEETTHFPVEKRSQRFDIDPPGHVGSQFLLHPFRPLRNQAGTSLPKAGNIFIRASSERADDSETGYGDADWGHDSSLGFELPTNRIRTSSREYQDGE
jgi:hypothetical protein